MSDLTKLTAEELASLHDGRGSLDSWSEIRRRLERLEECEAVCNEIQQITATYREQQASPYGVDTPGGLEHMGDVWRLLAKWDAMLAARAALEGKI